MPPSKFLLSVEVIRALYEYGLGFLLSGPLKFISPKGDGHPVIVLPGLGTADGSTYFVRNFLTHIGYDVHPWGMGRNLGPRNGLNSIISNLVKLTKSVSIASGNQQVSILGWSLGGIYAREVAKECPDLVRQVITLGTPFKNSTGTNVDVLYEFLSKNSIHKDPEMLKKIAVGPPVPFTSIYSKTDGVVNWQSSIEDVGPISENIEIPRASHLGLGHNPICMYVIANRLAQSANNWTHYQ